MAKKNKGKVEIKDLELTPTVIGEISSKKSGVILTIVMFMIFLAVVIFLPQITEFVENGMSFTPPVEETPTVPNVSDDLNNEEETSTAEDMKFNFTNDLKITNDLFVLDEFVIDDNVLSFKISNTTADTLDISQYNYFLYLYNSEDVLINIITLNDYKLTVSTAEYVNYYLSDENISYITLNEVKEENYPDVSLLNNTLTCILNENKYTYIFENNLLIKERLDVTINSSVLDYNIKLSDYTKRQTDLSLVTGVNSLLTTKEDGLNFYEEYDLNLYTGTFLDENLNYTLKSTGKVINFEIEARGYDCN